jgi:hypothetical protein
MPKKRVAVTLRTSSPAPEAASPASELSRDSDAELSESDSYEAPTVVQRVTAPEAGSVEAFVNGPAAALEQVARELPTAKIEQPTGPAGYREITIYLPEELAEQLTVHCLEHNLDLSRLVALALERHLSAANAPEASRALERALRAAARALLDDLAAWLQKTWSTRRRPWHARAAA